MALSLFHRDLGGKGLPHLILLHGLMGSSRNWQTLGKQMSGQYHVSALDLRNHGGSPHANEMNYAVMAEDVVAWMDDQGIDQAILLGHSMGGKVAMVAACHSPKRFSRLIVVDIAPKNYFWPAHRQEFAAMKALDLSTLNSRLEAEEILEKEVPSLALRKFLLTNLERKEDASWTWSVNLAGIYSVIDLLESNPLVATDRYLGATCFIIGGKSDYVKKEDEGLIRAIFPNVKLTLLPNAGHNPHMDSKDEFLSAVLSFTEQTKS